MPHHMPLISTIVVGERVVVVGHGRVGQAATRKLREAGTPFVVVEASEEREKRIPVISGNAADPEVAAVAEVPGALCLLVAIPDAFHSGQAVEQARLLHPHLPIHASAAKEVERDHLVRLGATSTVLGNEKLGRALADRVPLKPRAVL